MSMFGEESESLIPLLMLGGIISGLSGGGSSRSSRSRSPGLLGMLLQQSAAREEQARQQKAKAQGFETDLLGNLALDATKKGLVLPQETLDQLKARGVNLAGIEDMSRANFRASLVPRAETFALSGKAVPQALLDAMNNEQLMQSLADNAEGPYRDLLLTQLAVRQAQDPKNIQQVGFLPQDEQQSLLGNMFDAGDQALIGFGDAAKATADYENKSAQDRLLLNHALLTKRADQGAALAQAGKSPSGATLPQVLSSLLREVDELAQKERSALSGSGQAPSYAAIKKAILVDLLPRYVVANPELGLYEAVAPMIDAMAPGEDPYSLGVIGSSPTAKEFTISEKNSINKQVMERAKEIHAQKEQEYSAIIQRQGGSRNWLASSMPDPDGAEWNDSIAQAVASLSPMMSNVPLEKWYPQELLPGPYSGRIPLPPEEKKEEGFLKRLFRPSREEPLGTGEQDVAASMTAEMFAKGVESGEPTSLAILRNAGLSLEAIEQAQDAATKAGMPMTKKEVLVWLFENKLN